MTHSVVVPSLCTNFSQTHALWIPVRFVLTHFTTTNAAVNASHVVLCFSCIIGIGNLLFGRLYTFRISHFAGISRMFSRNTPQNTEHSLYTFRISYEFRVLLMPRKNKLWNPLTFHANANPGAKCKKRKEECKMWEKWYETPRYILFVFCISQSFSLILR